MKTENNKKESDWEIKSKEAKDYIHLGIEFSQREQFKDSGASYISGVGFGYSCGYQDGENDASQFTPTKEKEYREALENIEVEFCFMFPYGQQKGGGAYNLSSPIIIPQEKLPLIKKAIEDILNK